MNNKQDPVINVNTSESRDAGVEEPMAGDIESEIEDSDPSSEMERLQHEVAENNDKYQRAVADLANYRRRKEQESARMIQQAKDNMLMKFLPVVDDFARAIHTSEIDHANEDWLEGFILIEKKLRNVFEAEGVRQMVSVGEPFDPSLHDAVMVDENSSEPNTVVEEFQSGYYIGDRVLRPAVVKVGSGNTRDTVTSET